MSTIPNRSSDAGPEAGFIHPEDVVFECAGCGRAAFEQPEVECKHCHAKYCANCMCPADAPADALGDGCVRCQPPVDEDADDLDYNDSGEPWSNAEYFGSNRWEGLN